VQHAYYDGCRHPVARAGLADRMLSDTGSAHSKCHPVMSQRVGVTRGHGSSSVNRDRSSSMAPSTRTTSITAAHPIAEPRAVAKCLAPSASGSSSGAVERAESAALPSCHSRGGLMIPAPEQAAANCFDPLRLPPIRVRAARPRFAVPGARPGHRCGILRCIRRRRRGHTA
jgi:hypothetical protein